MLREQVQRPDRQPELAGMGQFADAVTQVDQLVASDLIGDEREGKKGMRRPRVGLGQGDGWACSRA